MVKIEALIPLIVCDRTKIDKWSTDQAARLFLSRMG